MVPPNSEEETSFYVGFCDGCHTRLRLQIACSDNLLVIVAKGSNFLTLENWSFVAIFLRFKSCTWFSIDTPSHFQFFFTDCCDCFFFTFFDTSPPLLVTIT